MTEQSGRVITDQVEFDVIVVGTGAGGLSTAAVAASRGLDVLVLEKADRIGGTTRKSAAALWLPANRFLVEAGIDDRTADVVRYLARLSRPALYDPEAERFGLPTWEYEQLITFCDNARAAQEELERLDALHLAPAPFGIKDYQGHLPEDLTPAGRTLYEAETLGGPTGGQVLVDKLAAGAEKHGAKIRTAHEVQDVIVDDDRVVGVIALTGGERVRIGARHGVVFASGGFSHNPEYRVQYLNGPFLGGCAAETNTGDFLRIATGLGAELANLSEAWTAPINIERMHREAESFMSSFYVLGDGMLEVNRAGHRVANEKAPYNEHGRIMSNWDSGRLRYANMPLIAIWDQGVADRWGIDRFGNPVPAEGVDPYWVVSGDSLSTLTAGIDAKLEELGTRAGGARLDPDFEQNLAASIKRFGELAAAGVDEDFHRGETEFERYVSVRFGDGDGPNPLMRPLDLDGPLHASILVLGTLDTKGGPRTTARREVVRANGSTIDGLYAVGNCAASPSGQGYPGAGATLGPIVVDGYLAGLEVAARAGK